MSSYHAEGGGGGICRNMEVERGGAFPGVFPP